MTMPSLLSCAPRSAGDTLSNTCAMVYVLTIILRFGLGRGLIIDFDLAVVAERANHFVTASDQLIAVLQASRDFDICRACDSRFHFAEFGLLAVDDEDTLDLFLPGLLRNGI